MTAGAELDALKSWTWQFGLQVTGFMTKASALPHFVRFHQHHAFKVSLMVLELHSN